MPTDDALPEKLWRFAWRPLHVAMLPAYGIAALWDNEALDDWLEDWRNLNKWLGNT